MKKTLLHNPLVLLFITAIFAVMPLPSSAQTAKPNLTLFDVAVPPDALVMSEPSSFTTTIFNNGTAPSTPCVFKLYASEDEFRDAKDKLIVTAMVPAIPADSFFHLHGEFVVPITIPRYTNHIFGIADAEGMVDESNEGDNEGTGRTSIDQRASFGKLHVTSNNNEMGTWKVVDFPKSFKFNTIVEDVPKGPERITFSPVAGFQTPADTTVIVVQGKTTLLHVEYKKINTALAENNADLIKAAFPNPASNEFNVKTYPEKITDVKVYDMQGREANIKADLISGLARIDISMLEPGFYFVEVRADNAITKVKLLKN